MQSLGAAGRQAWGTCSSSSLGFRGRGARSERCPVHSDVTLESSEGTPATRALLPSVKAATARPGQEDPGGDRRPRVVLPGAGLLLPPAAAGQRGQSVGIRTEETGQGGGPRAGCVLRTGCLVEGKRNEREECERGN